MKKVNEMNKNEFDVLRKKASMESLSPFAQFCLDSKGYDYFAGRRKLDRWEVFNMGYTDAKKIINKETKLAAVPKPK